MASEWQTDAKRPPGRHQIPRGPPRVNFAEHGERPLLLTQGSTERVFQERRTFRWGCSPHQAIL
jgi:hypothetical protein